MACHHTQQNTTQLLEIYQIILHDELKSLGHRRSGFQVSEEPLQSGLHVLCLAHWGDYIAEYVHDIAVATVTPSQTVAYPGYTIVDISVEVQNQGCSPETFDVTTYYDSTAIATQTVSLASASITITFNWDGASVSYEYYQLSAVASPVTGETDTADNTCIDDTVTVTIPGDVNGDGTVNVQDSAKLSAHFYSPPYFLGPLGYHPNADINNDGKVDSYDAAIVSDHWLQSWEG